MEELTLPEPGASLWRAKREIIHGIAPETPGRIVRPHLGGGTVLAARIGHRRSTDIDILLPGRDSLIDLAQENDENIIRRLGGKPEAVTDRRIKIGLAHGEIDLAIMRPIPSEGQEEARIDGHTEMVLNNAQILRGKLERADKVLVRDVVDVIVAGKANPQALATAISLLGEERAAAIAQRWTNADHELEGEFGKSIKGLDPQWPVDKARLGTDAARSLLAHRYVRVEIELDQDRLTIRKTIERGVLGRERYEAADAGRGIIASGIGGHLNTNGPMSGARLMEAMRRAQEQGEKFRFDSTSDASAKMRAKIDAARKAPLRPGGDPKSRPPATRPRAASSGSGQESTGRNGKSGYKRE